MTAEIEKVNRNTLTATTTDGDEYVQSGICNHIQDNEFEDGVRNLAGKTSYDLYFDKFGYLAAFTQTATSGDFTLLVDGWYNETRTAEEYAVRAYIDGEIVDTDVTEKSATKFIYNDNNTLNNSWDNLRYFAGLNNDGGKADGVKTIVASV